MKELTNANLFFHSNGLNKINKEWFEKAQYALNPSNMKSWATGIRFSQIPDLIISHLKPALLNSYIDQAKSSGELDGSLFDKYYFIPCTDEKGNIRNLSLSPDVSPYVDQHLRNYMIDFLDRENLWEDAVKWYWNNSMTWTLEAMSREFCLGAQARMSEKTWSKVYSKTLCYAGSERFNEMFDIYAQNFVALFMRDFRAKHLEPTHFNLATFEEFLGLNSTSRGLQSILQPRIENERMMYLTTLSRATYQQLRKAVAIVDFPYDDTKIWPSASLETLSGSSKGEAVLKVERDENHGVLKKLIQDMNDETVDVMDSICHLWLKKSQSHQMKILIRADDILDLRGLRKQKNGQGQRGGYKSEWRERIANHMNILDHLWINSAKVASSLVEEKAFIISKLKDFQQVDSQGEYTWEVRPGDPLLQDMLEGKRQTALLSKKTLELDPYRQSYEKRAARYFSWLWRSRQSRAQYLKPIRVPTLLEAIHLEYKKSRSAKIIERFEKMLDVLKDKGIIANWQYDRVYENGRDWLELKLVVEPPQAIIDQYAKIKLPTKNTSKPLKSDRGPISNLGAQLKKERLRRRLTQMQAAEEIGIDQTTVSKLELERRTPDYHTARRIQQWFAKSSY